MEIIVVLSIICAAVLVGLEIVDEHARYNHTTHRTHRTHADHMNNS